MATVSVVVGAGALLSLALGKSRQPLAHPATPGAHLAVTGRRSFGSMSAIPRLRVTVPAPPATSWTSVAMVRGQKAAWLAQRSGVTLMRFDQRLVHLTLHAGYTDGGAAGWTYGDRITTSELHLLIAAINGGFKLTYRNVGFMSGGHVAVAQAGTRVDRHLFGRHHRHRGLAGRRAERGQGGVLGAPESRLLVDRGVPAANVSDCVIKCWGGTIGLKTVVARSGLGVTAGGQLVWAAGERLTPARLATALIAAGAVRAIELDINPDWVAGYLYAHHPSGPLPVPVVPGQVGIYGKLLAPYSRDFLAFVAN